MTTPFTIELSTRNYFAHPRRGLRKWLYFARNPVLAFVSYQIAYPDPPDEAGARRGRLYAAVGMGLTRYLIRHHS